MKAHRPARLSPAARTVLTIGIAVAFGILIALVKGNGGGIRDAVGNISVVWLLLPFLAGAYIGRTAITGALAGLCATLAALTGFYFAESFVLDLGSHPWLTDLSLTMGIVVYYGERALVTGPVFGALGFWWRRRCSRTAAGLLAGAFVLEPLAWWIYGMHIGGGAAYPVPGYPPLWLGEIMAGIAGFAWLYRSARREATVPTPSG